MKLVYARYLRIIFFIFDRRRGLGNLLNTRMEKCLKECCRRKSVIATRNIAYELFLKKKSRLRCTIVYVKRISYTVISQNIDGTSYYRDDW